MLITAFSLPSHPETRLLPTHPCCQRCCYSSVIAVVAPETLQRAETCSAWSEHTHTPRKKILLSYKSGPKIHSFQESSCFTQHLTVLYKLCFVFLTLHRNRSKKAISPCNCKALSTLNVLNCFHVVRKRCEGCPEIWQGRCFITI